MNSALWYLKPPLATWLSNSLFRKHQSFELLALCEGNTSITGGFPSQMASNAENLSKSLHHHTMVLKSWFSNYMAVLTHWGWVTHICVSKLNIIGSDNGLSPGRRQAIIWTNDGILLIGPLRTNFSEIWIQINTFSFTKMHLKMLSGKCWPYCLGLNVLSKNFDTF